MTKLGRLSLLVSNGRTSLLLKPVFVVLWPSPGKTLLDPLPMEQEAYPRRETKGPKAEEARYVIAEKASKSRILEFIVCIVLAGDIHISYTSTGGVVVDSFLADSLRGPFAAAFSRHPHSR